MVSGKPFTISFLRGFRIAEHRYDRNAVDVLEYPIKPFRYELELELHADDLAPRETISPKTSVPVKPWSSGASG